MLPARARKAAESEPRQEAGPSPVADTPGCGGGWQAQSDRDRRSFVRPAWHGWVYGGSPVPGPGTVVADPAERQAHLARIRAALATPSECRNAEPPAGAGEARRTNREPCKGAPVRGETVTLCPVCGAGHDRRGPYCSNACKQKAYRQRRSLAAASSSSKSTHLRRP